MNEPDPWADLCGLFDWICAWTQDHPFVCGCVATVAVLVAYGCVIHWLERFFAPEPEPITEPEFADETPLTARIAEVNRLLDEVRAQATDAVGVPPPPEPAPEPAPLGDLARRLVQGLEGYPWAWRLEGYGGKAGVVRRDDGAISYELWGDDLISVTFAHALPSTERCVVTRGPADFSVAEWEAIRAAAAAVKVGIEGEQRKVKEREERRIIEAALGRTLGEFATAELAAELEARRAGGTPA